MAVSCAGRHAALAIPEDVQWHASRTPSPQVESRHRGTEIDPGRPRSLRKRGRFMPRGVWPELCVSDRPCLEAQCARRLIWGERSPSVPADFSAVGALPYVLGLESSDLWYLGSH